MRLYEFDEQDASQPADSNTSETGDIETPLSSNVNSLLLRLDASNVKQVKLDNFIDELNNMSNIPIDQDNIEEVNDVKQLIANTGKADIKGEYVILDYQQPESPGETDTQKIAMKNVKDNAS